MEGSAHDKLESVDEDEEEEEEELDDEEEELDDREKFRMFQHSSASSSETNYGPQTARVRGQLPHDYEKLKQRKAKLEQAIQERRKVARLHFEQGVEGVRFKIPDEYECTFDVTNTGLGGAKLLKGYRELLNREKTPKVKVSKYQLSKTRLESSSSSLSELSESLKFSNSSSSEVSESFKCSNTIRFAAPQHIEKRLKPPGEKICWLQERLEISSLSVRFEIPIDVRDFETMSVNKYLCNYCKIPVERMVIYRLIYRHHKSPHTQKMTSGRLPRAINDVLYDSVTERDITKFLAFLHMDTLPSPVEVKTFAALAATAERILYLSFVEKSGKMPRPGQVRSFLESADFSNLRLKLEGISMSDELRTLLFSL